MVNNQLNGAKTLRLTSLITLLGLVVTNIDLALAYRGKRLHLRLRLT